MENKIGYAVITTGEYKELVKKEIDLEIAWEDYGELHETYLDLKLEFEAIEKELKDLLLIITGNKERASYMEYHFTDYDLADKKEVTKYINENYMKNGVLKFRKVEETKEEETKEEETNE